MILDDDDHFSNYVMREVKCFKCQNSITQRVHVHDQDDPFYLDNGLWFECAGGWPSSVFDPLCREKAYIFVCDNCLNANSESVEIYTHRNDIKYKHVGNLSNISRPQNVWIDYNLEMPPGFHIHITDLIDVHNIIINCLSIGGELGDKFALWLHRRSYTYKHIPVFIHSPISHQSLLLLESNFSVRFGVGVAGVDNG